jgi:hypothetical protein
MKPNSVQLATLTASSRSITHHSRISHIGYVCTYIDFMESIYSLSMKQCSNFGEHMKHFKPTYINSYTTYIASLWLARQADW